MSTKAGIRIIKKGEMNKVDKLAYGEIELKRDTAGDIARTVMTWVSDLKNQKIEETRLAIQRFRPM